MKCERKECNDPHHGDLTALYGGGIFFRLEPGRFPLRVVPRVKHVALIGNVIIAIFPPTLRCHECFRLSVVGFIVGISSYNCRHVLYVEIADLEGL